MEVTLSRRIEVLDLLMVPVLMEVTLAKAQAFKMVVIMAVPKMNFLV